MEPGQEKYYDAVESQKKKDVDDRSCIEEYPTASAPPSVNLAFVGLNALLESKEAEMKQKKAELKKKEFLLREREKEVSVREDKHTQERLQRHVSVLSRKLEREEETRERKKREREYERRQDEAIWKRARIEAEERHRCELQYRKEKLRH